MQQNQRRGTSCERLHLSSLVMFAERWKLSRQEIDNKKHNCFWREGDAAFNDSSTREVDNALDPGNLSFSEMKYHQSGLIISEHALKEKHNEMRKEIQKGLINFHAPGNSDGGTFEDDDLFEGDESFNYLDSNAQRLK